MSDLLDAVRDPEPVKLALADRLEDEEIERALQKAGLVLSHASPIDILYKNDRRPIECQ